LRLDRLRLDRLRLDRLRLGRSRLDRLRRLAWFGPSASPASLPASDRALLSRLS
jgi:hypothetical protein